MLGSLYQYWLSTSFSEWSDRNWEARDGDAIFLRGYECRAVTDEQRHCQWIASRSGRRIHYSLSDITGSWLMILEMIKVILQMLYNTHVQYNHYKESEQ